MLPACLRPSGTLGPMYRLRALARHFPVHLFAVLLVLCVVSRPVLASLGEVHEIGHAGSTTHEHVQDQAGDAGHDGSAPGEALHALLHFAHCCGHVSALDHAAGTPGLAYQAAAAPTPGVMPPPGHAPPGSLFRPPIAG